MAVSCSRRSIQALLAIRPDSANLKTEDGISTVDPGQVAVAARSWYGQESGSLTAAITGESLSTPLPSPGESVPAGVTGGNGAGRHDQRFRPLEVEVAKSYGETSLARILDLVENAAGRKALPRN